MHDGLTASGVEMALLMQIWHENLECILLKFNEFAMPISVRLGQMSCKFAVSLELIPLATSRLVRLLTRTGWNFNAQFVWLGMARPLVHLPSQS